MSRRQRIVLCVGVVTVAGAILLLPWRVQWTIVTLWGSWPERKVFDEDAEVTTETVWKFLFTPPQPPVEQESVLPATARILDQQTDEPLVVVGIENRDFERRIHVGFLLLELSAVAFLVTIGFWMAGTKRVIEHGDDRLTSEW